MFRKSAVAFALLGVVATLGCLVAANDKDQPAKDRKALQGKWTAKKGDDTMSFTIDDAKFALEGKGKSFSGTFTIDPTQKVKSMDLTIKEAGDEEGKKYVGKAAKAIYSLDGDKLKWLAHEPGKDERPADFPKEGEPVKGLYLQFERAKK
jgi:uncharacterized protein (TIGR03067 family)